MKLTQVVPVLSMLSLLACSNGRPSQHVETSQQKKEAFDALNEFQEKGSRRVLEKKNQQFRSYGYVIDAAQVFDEQTERILEQAFDSMCISTGAQGYLVSFPGMVFPSEFGPNVGKGVGIGIEHVDNGIIITLDPSKQKEYLHARTGYGIEGSLPDISIARALRASLQEIKGTTKDKQILSLISAFEKNISEEDIAIIKAKVKKEVEVHNRNIVVLIIVLYIVLLCIAFLLMKYGGGNGLDEVAEIMVKLLLFPLFIGGGDFGGGGA